MSDEIEEPSTALLEPISTIQPLSPTEVLALPPSEITPSLLESSFTPLSDAEALAFSSNLISSGKLDNSSIVRSIIQFGQSRSSSEYERLEQEIGEDRYEDDARNRIGEDKVREELIRGWTILEEVKRRLDTWDIILPKPAPAVSSPVDEQEEKEEITIDPTQEEEMELDDPWGEEDVEDDHSKGIQTPSALLDDPWNASTSNPSSSPTTATAKLNIEPPSSSDNSPPSISLPLTSFLTQPIPLSALDLASTSSLTALKVVCQRHHQVIYPFRFAIIEAVPGWVSPVEIEKEGLLPSLGNDDNEKWIQPISINPPSLFPILSKFYLPPTYTYISPTIQSIPTVLSSQDLTNWYINHILSLDSLGILDNQLAWVQHGASLGVIGLDEIGEDLSLLSRLVYDGNLTPSQHSQWTLGNWQKSSSDQIINAYVSNSTPEGIVGDIKRLVLPYLYVLESRAERAGKSDPTIKEKLLHDSILSLPLHLALPIFESSKATLPLSERIIKNDLDVARLALSILYGTQEKSKATNIWSIMSSIFECLPVWELNGTDEISDSELTSTTLESIANFIRPTTTSPIPTSKDLWLFFHPLPFASLSRALDILDVHLESGEILSKWNIYVQLSFLLQSSKNQKDQFQLAENLVRKQLGKNLDENGWKKLWDDMNRLSGGQDALLRGALGMLDQNERAKIYLGGVLSSGNFDIARKMIRKLSASNVVNDKVIEEVVLETSKEFYLSAESGNIHTGEMKLAYDVLSVAPQTPKITSEKSYIEATSRLTTFSSISLTPTEIRHTSNSLRLIERVIESSEDAYKHPDIILDLSNKLGASSEVEIGLVRAMIGRKALNKNDWVRSKESIQGMIEIIRNRSRRNNRNHPKSDSITPISSITQSTTPSKLDFDSRLNNQEDQLIKEIWELSFSLSTQIDYYDIKSKLILLSYSLELCPSSSIPSVLTTFKVLEGGRIKLDEASKRRREAGISTPNIPLTPSSLNENEQDQADRYFNQSQSHQGEEERVLGSRTAAKAAKLAMDLSGRYGLSVNNLRTKAAGYHSPIMASNPVLSQLPFNLSRSSSRSPNPSSRTPIPSSIPIPIRSEDDRSDAGSEHSTNTSRGPSHAHAPRELFEGIGADEAERVRLGARRALVRGVGWLLGAEEGEITGE
ncbi:uncharacterized protein IL334_002378 [Kwoniella shivajii]|uniref:Sec39 domain-containing protein n=1 Tax=Kwoniella shivajii TaxID=564305 RepID=A0ABZ1CW92_9TREE|nr:hypothetical protein IL334_002378 [Kwoniella shivajii]